MVTSQLRYIGTRFSLRVDSCEIHIGHLALKRVISLPAGDHPALHYNYRPWRAYIPDQDHILVLNLEASSLTRHLLSYRVRNFEVGFPPGSIPSQDMWNLWWAKLYQGKYSPRSMVSPVTFHSTTRSTPIYHHHPGLVPWGQLVAGMRNGLSLTPPHT
jgi:hypothetical protein